LRAISTRFDEGRGRLLFRLLSGPGLTREEDDEGGGEQAARVPPRLTAGGRASRSISLPSAIAPRVARS
jgi:hypothetical protein